MLVFVIPIKSRKISRSWETLSKLFERCLKSTCNQTSPNFRVVVVCNEQPSIQFEHPNVEYIKVDFAPPVNSLELKEKEFIGYDYIASSEIISQDKDKARKIVTGLKSAEKFQPSHIMFVDADDCVSRYLAEFVEQHQDADGWVMKKGYIYKEGSKFLYQNVKNFNHICGTSIIINFKFRYQLFANPDMCNWSFDEFPGAELQCLPFIGSVYSVANGENIFMTTKTKSQMQSQNLKQSLPKLIEKLKKYRFSLINKSIVNDFNLYSIY